MNDICKYKVLVVDNADFYVDISDWHERHIQAEAMFVSHRNFCEYARSRIEVQSGMQVWFAHTQYICGRFPQGMSGSRLQNNSMRNRPGEIQGEAG